MPSHCVVRLGLAVAIAAAQSVNCPAQEVATVDLTKVTARAELRRPEAAQAESEVRGFTEDNQGSCPLTFPGVGAVPAKQVELQIPARTHDRLRVKNCRGVRNRYLPEFSQSLGGGRAM